MIRNHRRREESRQLKTAMPVRRFHHRDLAKPSTRHRVPMLETETV
jgi:hypothetical protein